FSDNRMVTILIKETAFKALFASFFLVTVWFSFALHGQVFLVEFTRKPSVKSANAARNRSFIAPNNNIERPTFKGFFINVVRFRMRQFSFLASIFGFVRLVLKINLYYCKVVI